MNKIDAVIYKVQPYQESSRLLYAFTKKGKVTLLARGSQKLNSDLRIASQYLTYIEFEYNTFKNFIPIAKVKIINDFNSIKSDFNKTKAVSIMLELISKVFIDDEYNEKIFNLLVQSLTNSDLTVSVLSFSLKLLYYLGYGMNLIGDGKNIKGVSIKKGGLVYEEENDYIDLNYDETFILLKLTYSKIDELEEIALDKVEVMKKFVYNYYLDKLEIRIKAIE